MTRLPAACVAALLLSAPLAEAMPLSSLDVGTGPTVSVRYHHRHGRPLYRVNRYGYGHYTRGPGGSYGPYPGGSGAAFVYKQQRHDFCEYAPSRC